MRKVCLVLIALLLLGCSAVPQSDQTTKFTSNLVIAEPLFHTFRAQRAMAHLNQLVLQAELSPEERAQLFFQRGLLYDSMGLDALALFDYQQAIQLKPDMAGVYNSIGIHQTLSEAYIEAYEAFDSVLEIDPSYHFAYLNRAIAQYYDQRFELAKLDIDEFVKYQPDDVYRVLWRFIIYREIDEAAALAQLQLDYAAIPNSQWAKRIIAFYLGNITQAALLGDVLLDLDNQQQLSERLCEVYFYLAKFYTQRGQVGVAKNYFKLALATNVYEFVEHRFARYELRRLSQS
jgi:lipoprotein NlpI